MALTQMQGSQLALTQMQVSQLASTQMQGSQLALTQTQVSQLYVSIFGRASEGEGNTYWQNDPASTDMTTTANIMLDTPAAATYFGASLDSDADFVAHIYTNTLGKSHADDSAGQDYWIGRLAAGVSKGQMVNELISAAQAPENAGAAQNMFMNQVAVSDYCAENIATADVNDLSAFTAYIAGVTDDAAMVRAAQADMLADAGQAFTLTTGIAALQDAQDAVSGFLVTAAEDAFDDAGFEVPVTLEAGVNIATAASDIFLADADDASITNFNLLGDDTLFIGSDFTFNAGDLADDGDNTVLEVFLTESAGNTVITMETETWSSNSAEPENAITLTGVALDDVVLADGFIDAA
jgi:hypothetical protein